MGRDWLEWVRSILKAEEKMTVKVKINLKNPTGNFWIDNGLVILYDLFAEGEFDAEKLLDNLIEKLVVETGNIGTYYDLSTQQIREYKKKNWVYPTNIFIKSTPRADKIKIKGKPYFLNPPQYTLKLSFSKTKSVCDICGLKDHLADAKMWMFPFAVEPTKFSNFYSGLKRGTKLCPRCALAGLAGYLGWLWKAKGRDRLHIFVFYSDLKTMYNLRIKVFKPFEHSGEIKGGNVPVAFSGDYIHETLLGLLLRLFRELKKPEVLSEEGEKVLEEIFGESFAETPLTLYAFSGKPGQAFNMDTMIEFSEFKTLYRLYMRWFEIFDQPEVNRLRIIENVFRQFQRMEGKNWNTIWRDRIAWAMLDMRDPSVFIEDFIFEARVREENPRSLAFGTFDIFETYWKEVIKMDERLLNVLKGFGHTLGRTAKQRSEMGLLFALRNAKNPDEFFRVLNDIQFRLELTIPEDILEIGKGEKIKGSPWLRVKTLLSIYAMNSYLYSAPSNQEV